MAKEYLKYLASKNEKFARDEILVQLDARDVLWLTSLGLENVRYPVALGHARRQRLSYCALASARLAAIET